MPPFGVKRCVQSKLMDTTMLRWFERRLNPYPPEEPDRPPDRMLAFMLHYLNGAKRYFAAMMVLTALVALSEIVLFGILGHVVDWLTTANRATFLADQGPWIWLIGVGVVIVMPIIVILESLVINQVLMANIAQRIRWLLHRFVLRHSMSYFQDEFAGRIASNLMTTALAVRDSAMKVLNVLNYVAFYFAGAVVLAALNDWRLGIPFVAWITGYGVLLRIFIPRLADVSEKQASARALMTGRVVDAYTNISTVKLFSHSNREANTPRKRWRSSCPLRTGRWRWRRGSTSRCTCSTSLCW